MSLIVFLQMARIDSDLWWIGLHTFENDGRFRWSDHSVLNYVSWGLGQPRPLTRDRKCAHISASKGSTMRIFFPTFFPALSKNQFLSLKMHPYVYNVSLFHSLSFFLSLSGEWADKKCHLDMPYVCKRVNVTGTPPPTPAPPLIPAGCPDGWSPFLHKVQQNKYTTPHILCLHQVLLVPKIKLHLIIINIALVVIQIQILFVHTQYHIVKCLSKS